MFLFLAQLYLDCIDSVIGYMFCIHLLKEINKMYTASTPAECYVRAAVLCRRHVFTCAVIPGWTSLAFTLKDDRRDEIGLLS